MLMLISPTQGPKVPTNKHKLLASPGGTGGCYEYFCSCPLPTAPVTLLCEPKVV